MRGPNRPPSVIHARPMPRPTTVPDAASQLPITRGNTGGLSRPINPDNQPLGTTRRGYGATPQSTPIDSKIGYRGQEIVSYNGAKCSPKNRARRGKK